MVAGDQDELQKGASVPDWHFHVSLEICCRVAVLYPLGGRVWHSLEHARRGGVDKSGAQDGWPRHSLLPRQRGRRARYPRCGRSVVSCMPLTAALTEILLKGDAAIQVDDVLRDHTALGCSLEADAVQRGVYGVDEVEYWTAPLLLLVVFGSSEKSLGHLRQDWPAKDVGHRQRHPRSVQPPPGVWPWSTTYCRSKKWIKASSIFLVLSCRQGSCARAAVPGSRTQSRPARRVSRRS